MLYVCNRINRFMIRTALFGSINNIEVYAENLKESEDCLLVGIFCGHSSHQQLQYTDHPARIFESPEELVDLADAIIFTDAKNQDYDLLKRALTGSRHVFLLPDKHLSYARLEKLYKLSEEAGVMLYVQNNIVPFPLRTFMNEQCKNPEFIDIYRYLKHSNSIAGKSIIETLYKELLFILSLNKSNVRRFFTSNVPYYSPDPSLINVRIEFENATTSSLTINNYTEIDSRNTEIFVKDKMILMNTICQEIKIIRNNPNVVDKTKLPVELQMEDTNVREMKNFLQKIVKKEYQIDAFTSGVMLQKTANEILHQIIPYSEISK